MTIKRIGCSAVVKAIECVNPRRGVWAVRFDVTEDVATGSVSCLECRFEHLPTMEEITAAVSGYVDAETNAAIEAGITVNGVAVALTDATQRNFLFAAHEAARTGEVDAGTFGGLIDCERADAAAQLDGIVSEMWRHIRECRKTGRERKTAYLSKLNEAWKGIELLH